MGEDVAKRGVSGRQLVVVGALALALVMVAGTFWAGEQARTDTEQAVRSVSLFYLDELAGRREKVVASNLASSVRNLNVAVGLMDDEDLSDVDHLHEYQARMKALYNLEKFAFVDADGLIYTSLGEQDNIADYPFDYRSLAGPSISVLNKTGKDKKVIIAVPLEGVRMGDVRLVASFMEIGMDRMMQGVSVDKTTSDSTICNIYTTEGVALTDMVLGGLASEDNLLDSLGHAELEEGSTAEDVSRHFAEGTAGVVSFTYDGIRESLAYVPIEGTDWMLTYLIRESVISDRIGSVTRDIIMRSLVQSVLVALVMLALFVAFALQTRRSACLELEKETALAENVIKREELERRIELQERLLEEERRRVQQDKMITALASDYRSVYYVDLDADWGTCYRVDSRFDGGMSEGDDFEFSTTFAAYAHDCVTEQYREGFLEFVDPATIRVRLASESIIAYRYLALRNGKESYEMLRMAGVRHPQDRDDNQVHAVGVGFTNIDAEAREAMAKNEALSDALALATEANRAKTAFLSNMSHEIRTPMNAIIGLDNIALNEEGISDTTRDYLEKIGSSAEHLLSLINDILDMSRIESGRMALKSEEFSFSTLMEQVNTIFSGQCEERGLDYQCRIVGEVDDCYIGDNMKLRQVLINILGNAVKFTPEGGQVRLGVRRVAQFDDKSTLEFTISDTGIGMSEEYLPHIFDTFSQEDSSSTNKYGSSGLGLAITKSIVEMMNGRIDVTSKKGEGSTFVVSVTLGDSERSGIDAHDEQVQPHDIRVLIVDDDPIACEHARLVLGQVGISADSAESGEEAVRMVRLRHARHNAYNLVLVDWRMPGMDGIETTRRIRQVVGKDSAIIILTAYRWDDVADEAVEAGVDSFLSKPLFAASVLDEFREVLRKRGLTGTGAPKADLAGRRVLIAEDVDINAEILSMVLEMREVGSERAENGRVAVQMFAESPVGYYDAILMDIRMPELDGLEATARIRALERADARTIPIVALTANAFDEDVQRSLQMGLNAHLSKPVEPDLLFETLETMLAQQP